MVKIKPSKQMIGAIAVLLFSLMAANLLMQPAQAATAGNSAGPRTFPQPLPPSGMNTTQSGASPQASTSYGCEPDQSETLVTQVNAQVALDAIGMGSNSFTNWMGLAAVSNLNLDAAAEVGIAVDYNNGWGTPYVYLTTWWGGHDSNVLETTATPSGLALGQTIGLAVGQYQGTWHGYYNLNKGAGWQEIGNRYTGFTSTSYVFSSCESTIGSGIQGNIFGQWSGVNYQQNNGANYNVNFQNLYLNDFNHFSPVNYYNNNAWYGQYTQTG